MGIVDESYEKTRYIYNILSFNEAKQPSIEYVNRIDLMLTSTDFIYSSSSVNLSSIYCNSQMI